MHADTGSSVGRARLSFVHAGDHPVWEPRREQDAHDLYDAALLWHCASPSRPRSLRTGRKDANRVAPCLPHLVYVVFLTQWCNLRTRLYLDGMPTICLCELVCIPPNAGSVCAPFVAHVFCNAMGLPRVPRRSSQRQYYTGTHRPSDTAVALHLAGIAAFVQCLPFLTSYPLYTGYNS